MSANDLMISPDVLLARFLIEQPSVPEIVILTGASRSGKTTWLQALLARAANQHTEVHGVISPAVFVEAEKIGIDLVDIAQGSHRRLAERKPAAADENGVAIQTFAWRFFEETIAWGNDLLRQISGCDRIVLDEFGPLEWDRGQGLIEGMRVIDRGCFAMAIVVVRPFYLHMAIRRWPSARVCKISPRSSAILKEKNT